MRKSSRSLVTNHDYETEMGVVCSTLEEDEKRVHSFSRKAWSRTEGCDTQGRGIILNWSNKIRLESLLCD